MNLTSQHLSIDTETLAFNDNAIILSIAITPFKLIENTITFDELLYRTFFVKLNAKLQHKQLKRVVDKDTVTWWKTQPLEVKKYSFTPNEKDVSPKDALIKLNEFLDSTEYDFKNSYIFERGMGYDTNKIETIFKQCDVNLKLNLWRAREIRTINDLLGDVHNGKWELPTGRPNNFIEHHAKHDAALDALRLIKLFDLNPNEL